MADAVITFDEILADPVYKSEFDRRVTKALSTVQSKLDAEVEKNRKYEAAADGESVESLKKQLEELQGKYDTEMKEYQTQLADRNYSDAVSRAIAEKGIKFSSKAAEKAFLADLKANRLEMKDGELLGFEDYHKAQMEADPTAFQADKPAPTFVKRVGTGGPPPQKISKAREISNKYAQERYGVKPDTE